MKYTQAIRTENNLEIFNDVERALKKSASDMLQFKNKELRNLKTSKKRFIIVTLSVEESDEFPKQT